jgi:hypothetical protein
LCLLNDLLNKIDAISLLFPAAIAGKISLLMFYHILRMPAEDNGLKFAVCYFQRLLNFTLSLYQLHDRLGDIERTSNCAMTKFEARFEIAIHDSWIPAQICPEQICINPKGSGQDSPE